MEIHIYKLILSQIEPRIYEGESTDWKMYPWITALWQKDRASLGNETQMFFEIMEAEYTAQGIIEGDQIEIAAFSLESFAYLTGLVTANNNADSNSARSHYCLRYYWL